MADTTKPKTSFLKKTRQIIAKTWHFLWHDDSIIAWIVSIIVAFLLIKFVLYPLAGLVMGTSLPVVAVVSSSMDHRALGGVSCGVDAQGKEWWDVCGEWYIDKGLTEDNFTRFPFKNGFWKGDIMMLWHFNPAKAKIGDVIVFQSSKDYPIIHRVVAKWQESGRWYFATKGDHNEEQIKEYVVTDGTRYYRCYQVIDNTFQPSLCGPGIMEAGPDTPNSIKILDETRIPENEIIGNAAGRLPLLGWIKIWAVNLYGLIIPD